MTCQLAPTSVWNFGTKKCWLTWFKKSMKMCKSSFGASQTSKQACSSCFNLRSVSIGSRYGLVTIRCLAISWTKDDSNLSQISVRNNFIWNLRHQTSATKSAKPFLEPIMMQCNTYMRLHHGGNSELHLFCWFANNYYRHSSTVVLYE